MTQSGATMFAPLFFEEFFVEAFIVDQGTPEDFVSRVRREIKAREFEDIASIFFDGGAVVVVFSWMGTTSLTYRIQLGVHGFSAHLERRKVSPFHAPFKAGFVERFDHILAKVGARSL